MTNEERIKQITKVVNDLNLDDLGESDFWEEMKNKNFNDLYNDIWKLRCAIDFIVDVLNM